MALETDYTAIGSGVVVGDQRVTRTTRLDSGEEWLEVTLNHTKEYPALSHAAAKNYCLDGQNDITSGAIGDTGHYFRQSRLDDQNLNSIYSGFGFTRTVNYSFQESQRPLQGYTATREIESRCVAKVVQAAIAGEVLMDFPAVTNTGGVVGSFNQTITVTRPTGATGTAYMLKFLNGPYPGETLSSSTASSFDITVTARMIVWVAGYYDDTATSGAYFNGKCRLMFFDLATLDPS